MEHCKNCQTELEEGVTLCPQCGTENAPEETAPVQETAEETVQAENPQPEENGAVKEVTEAPLQAEQKQEQPAAQAEITPGITLTLTPGKIALAVAALVLIVALLVALVVGGMRGKDDHQNQNVVPAESTQAQEQPVETTAPPTIPEDGDPDNETCKGSYTASDEEVIAAKDTVIATAGDKELTLGMLQIYYWQEVTGFLNQYGQYAMYFGLDYTQPLETQVCGIMEGRTWQQYFLLSALNSWRTYTALDIAAENAEFEMDQEYADYLAELPQKLEEEAVAGGFASAKELMEYNVGVGSEVEDYVTFMEVYYHGYSYFEHCYENFEVTDEEIEQTFLEHEAEYAENGLTKETKTVDVRHILVYPEGATSETVRTETFPEEAWAAGEAAAQEILDAWLAGEATEHTFAELAGEHSGDPGSAANGGLYTGVNQGDMVEEFDAWCFDPERKAGDYGIVKTVFGYHIMYYSGETFLWKDSVKEDVLNEKANDLVDGEVEKNPLTVQWDKILLCFLDLSR